jgi:AraC-like DNA-binding protein
VADSEGLGSIPVDGRRPPASPSHASGGGDTGVEVAEWGLNPDSLHRILAEVQPPNLTSAAAQLLLAAAEIAARDGSALDFAAAVGMNARTLSRVLGRARLPPGIRLLQWLRVLVAAKVLECPGATVAEAAAASGYSTRGAVARVIKDLTGMAPSTLVKRGPFRTALSLFRGELAGYSRR